MMPAHSESLFFCGRLHLFKSLFFWMLDPHPYHSIFSLSLSLSLSVVTALTRSLNPCNLLIHRVHLSNTGIRVCRHRARTHARTHEGVGELQPLQHQQSFVGRHVKPPGAHTDTGSKRTRSRADEHFAMLEDMMQTAANNLDYEEAAKIRDEIKRLREAAAVRE